jgi:hypothetical protein
MQLATVVDSERIAAAWQCFWNHELHEGRPLVVASVTKPGRDYVAPGHLRYYSAVTGDYAAILERIDRQLDTTEYLAEALPHFGPDHGPDQFAAFFGSDLRYSEDSPQTNWVVPCVGGEGWEPHLPLRLDEANSVWRSALELSRRMAAHADGRYLVGVCDLHSNMDALSAMRGPERLCMDLYDCPELVERAMADVRAAYQPVYNALYEAGGMNTETGSCGWIPFWCEGRFATIQCDFMCMLSPEMNRRFVIPALEEEAQFLDHCVLHFDGPDALPHLDDVLAIEAIDAVQWVPGAGQPPMHTWMDVLQRIQAAGKALHIYGVDAEQVKLLHRALKPELTVYCPGCETREEVAELLEWLQRNT